MNEWIPVATMIPSRNHQACYFWLYLNETWSRRFVVAQWQPEDENGPAHWWQEFDDYTVEYHPGKDVSHWKLCQEPQ